MLKININERISWDEYFNHTFFNDNFEFNCFKQSNLINYYCKECKKNICNNFVKEYIQHIILFPLIK